MRNTVELAKTLFCLLALAVLVVTDSQAETKHDCCGSGEEIYRASTQRIKIFHSPELNKQLAALKNKPVELARLYRAIEVGNKLIQGHVNNDLYVYNLPFTTFPPPSTVYEDGWKKNFGSMVSVSVEAFREFHEKRRMDGYYGYESSNKRHNHFVCPHSQLDVIQPKGDKIYLSYHFVHIARPNTVASHMLDASTLDLSRNGKTQTKNLVLNADFQLHPYDDAGSDWWYATGKAIKTYKRDLQGREQGNGGFEKNKPNLRKLLTQITEAEKVCNKQNPFQ